MSFEEVGRRMQPVTVRTSLAGYVHDAGELGGLRNPFAMCGGRSACDPARRASLERHDQLDGDADFETAPLVGITRTSPAALCSLLAHGSPAPRFHDGSFRGVRSGQ